MGARLYVPALGRFLQVDPLEGGVDNDYVWPTDPVGKNDLTGRCVLMWCDGFDFASDILLVAGIATLFFCPVCAIAVAAASLVVGVAKLASGRADGVFDIAGVATFGVGRVIGRVGGAVTNLSRASLVADMGPITPRTGARFARTVVGPVSRTATVAGAALQAPSAMDLFDRAVSAIRQTGRFAPAPVRPRVRLGGGRLYAV